MRYLAIVGLIAGWYVAGPWAALCGLLVGQYMGNYMWGVSCAIEDAERRADGLPPKWAPLFEATARRD